MTEELANSIVFFIAKWGEILVARGGMAVCCYMLGVGGMGMLPLACYLVEKGHEVYGWDDHLGEPSEGILKLVGVRLQDTLPDVDVVIFSSAISANHPLRVEAERRGIRCVRRGHFLAEILKDKKLLAIIGSHGKTTTTGLIITALRRAQFDCGYLMGAVFQNEVLPGHFSSTGDWVIAEIDESDGTMEAFEAERTLVVNFDWDHISHYKTEDALKRQFESFLRRTRERVILPFGLKDFWANLENVALWGEPGSYRFRKGTYLSTLAVDKDFDLPYIGAFNVENTLAAIECVRGLVELKSDAFLDYAGIRRRQECLLRAGDLTVYQDYAHHPREIQAFLSYAADRSNARKIIIFQPHRYSRTRQFTKEFADVLKGADQLILLPVYAASESRDLGVDTDAIYDQLKGSMDVTYTTLESFSLQYSFDTPTDVLFVGAGDIEVIARDYAKNAIDFLKRQLSVNIGQTRLTCHEPLGPKTSLKIGGNALFFAEPDSESSLIQLLQNACKLPVFTLGRGSNLLVPDEGFAGLVISMNVPWLQTASVENDVIVVGAGLRLKELCGFATKNGIGGYTFMDGIPGSVGGALRMNAGAMGAAIGEKVLSVEALDRQDNKHVLDARQLHFEYRACRTLDDKIVLRARMAVLRESRETLEAQRAQFLEKRKQSQPVGASAGSTFKNPPGDYAGRLIEQAGLKGTCVGGAEVSQKHANFILNQNRASSRDVVSLVKHIKKTIVSTSNIALEPEILFLGHSWKDVL